MCLFWRSLCAVAAAEVARCWLMLAQFFGTVFWTEATLFSGMATREHVASS